MSLLRFQLAALEFPPKKLFGNRDERMVAERRNQLEAGRTQTHEKLIFCPDTRRTCDVSLLPSQRYLRNLFRVMLTSSSSPLRAADDAGVHLSKHAVCELSSFFKKGVFEHSSHGTG